MTLTELQYVLTLSRERNFGRAAKACHVSQPTLSVAINKLESELGLMIFERDRNQVRVTEVGGRIVEQAQRVIDEANKIKQIAGDGRNQLQAPLKIGAIYTVGPYLFPNLIPRIKKLAPDMPLIIKEDFTANLRTKLLNGDLDAIIVSLPFKETGVVTQALYDEPFVVLMRTDHPLSQKTTIQANELTADEMLLLGEGHCFRQEVIEACPKCYTGESETQQTVEGSSLETLRHMVASGMGITVLPSSATQINYYKSILCTKPFAGQPPQRRIGLVWRVSFTRPKAIGVLIQALQQTDMQGVCLLP